MIRNNQNRRRRGSNNGPRPQQMGAGNNYGNRLDNRQRGNASQLLEKYRALARDAQQAGDRVTAEYYLQYADHYYRVLGDYREKAPADNRQRGRDFYEDDATGYTANGDESDAGDDDDQDNDRSEARADERNDDGGRQWRDDRGSGNARPRETQPRDQRNDGNRSENGRTDGRERQNWNGSGRPRDENRVERPREEQRPRDDQRPRDENRAERPREEQRPREDQRPRDEQRPREEQRPRDEQRVDGRNDRSVRRERRPEAPRSVLVEAAMVDEGPIPGLPGPATLRIRRPASGETPVRERAPRREAEVAIPVAEAVPAPPPPAELVSDAEAPAPRRRGRPRKVVEAAPTEG